MKRSIDISGLRFGRLLVVAADGARGGVQYWICSCDCGQQTTVSGVHLRKGRTISCGCAQRDASTKHGLYQRPEYSVWRGAVQRCHNPRSPKFKFYGARGVEVAACWREDFAAFFAHVGPRPSLKHSLDRIDNSHGYEPGNVRWATQKEQCRNMRSNVYYEAHGLRMTLPEWAEHLGRPLITLQKRLKAGWPVEEALTSHLRVQRLRCSAP